MKETILTKNQKKLFRKEFTQDGRKAAIVVTVRYDDQCRNGHNTFAITREIYTTLRQPGEGTILHSSGVTLWLDSWGCLHDEIAEHFPNLAPLLKWHLTSPDGPMHYLANTIYHAGDRDCNGLRAGEFRPHTSRGPHQNGGVPGVLSWVLELPDRQARDIYSNEKPEPVVCEWKQYGRTGEGKAWDLNAARACAVWPDATDAELSQEEEPLRAALLARLPKLMADFQTAVESLGFTY